MAGHSKWANIRHRKGVADARRGRLFTKLIREISVAAHAGGDPTHNPRLRVAMDKALGANMTKDTIERAVQRGTGELTGASFEEVRYEGYAPGGVAVLIECQTDNRTRTAGDVRHAFAKFGGNLGTDGSVAFLFHRTGVITFAPGTQEDDVMAAAIDAGAEDVTRESDGSVEVLTAVDALHTVQSVLQQRGLQPAHVELQQRAQSTVTVVGHDAENVLKLLESLEALDDVQQVYVNAEFPDAMLQAVS